MSQRVLLTGATGFVGRQLLRELQQRGYKVSLVIRQGSELKIESLNVVEHVFETSNIFEESSEWWTKVCNDIDVLIHAAWYAEPGAYLTSPKNIECLTGTLKLAIGAAQAKIKRFIGLGTCFEYELGSTPLMVDSTLRPVSLYAASKASAFMMLSQYFGLTDISFGWCRLFYLYGDGEDSRRFVANLHRKLALGEVVELTQGAQIRDYLDVGQAAKQIIDMAFSRKEGPINICSGLPKSIRALAESIADIYGRRDLLVFGARPDNLIDPPYLVGVRDF